jgi:hypothetical protein
MKEYDDLSGEFNTKMKIEDFSKEALIKLWKSASRSYAWLAGIYIADLRERHGEKMAFDINAEVWEKWLPDEVRLVREPMNIQGNDVEAYFKFLRSYGLIGGLMDIDLELINKNHGIYTVKHCPVIYQFEKRNDPEGARHMCLMDDNEKGGYRTQAHQFNPKMKVKCLTPLPRKSKDDVYCRWEFKIED